MVQIKFTSNNPSMYCLLAKIVRHLRPEKINLTEGSTRWNHNNIIWQQKLDYNVTVKKENHFFTS